MDFSIGLFLSQHLEAHMNINCVGRPLLLKLSFCCYLLLLLCGSWIQISFLMTFIVGTLGIDVSSNWIILYLQFSKTQIHTIFETFFLG